jgi:choline dehydrogenase-like flavoprotein
MVERSFDVVIVGSGAGGGTVAQALAPACREGLRVAVLEWGPKLREDEYTGREAEMAEKLYFDSGGVLTRDRTMTLAFGRAYGGSTVVYTGTSLPLPPDVLGRWGVPGLNHDDLLARSKKYMTQNNVHILEEDRINDNNRLFAQACRRLGYRVEQFPINVKGCKGSGLCNLGCPNAAKQGTHRVQLPAAAAAGVEVITNCKVERIGSRECVDGREPTLGRTVALGARALPGPRAGDRGGCGCDQLPRSAAAFAPAGPPPRPRALPHDPPRADPRRRA